MSNHMFCILVQHEGRLICYGPFKDRPRVMRIVEYTDMGGKLAYGIEYEHQVGKYAESAYVHNPRVYWEAKD